MTSPPAPPPPTVGEIEAIAGMPDAGLRNACITWAYYRLNRAMEAITGPADLSWCGFAVWASKTAGVYIRQDELDPFIEEWVQGATSRAGMLATTTARLTGVHRDAGTQPAGRHHFTLREFARQVIGEVGEAIGGGNQDVFRHIAPAFARLVALWNVRGGQLTGADRAAFMASLDDPSDPQRDYLTRAFAATFDAIATSDPRHRAQLLLQANALVGCAEQTRVQPFIERSMTCPIADLFHADLAAHLHGRFGRALGVLLHRLMARLAPALETEFARLSTHWMMTLRVPGAALHLGRNVPPLPDGQMYPEGLLTLDAPEPGDLFATLHATDANACAAQDWARYDQRMRYIGVLFRSRQQERTLWDTPFTSAQVDQLQSGRLPDGPL
jgi:hypothetical protein